MGYLEISIMLVLLYVGSCDRFCAWLNSTRKWEQLKVPNMPKPTWNPYVINQKQQSTTKVNSPSQIIQIALTLRKNKPSPSPSPSPYQKFRSYHPHYLHSYSYPQKISPHLYFGSKNKANTFIFLVKDNQTHQTSNQIFYINNVKQESTRNNQGLEKGSPLAYALVLQIQDLKAGAAREAGGAAREAGGAAREVGGKSGIFLRNFGGFLGIVCRIYQGYYRSFLVYLSEKGKRAVPFGSSSQFTISVRNITNRNNQQTWRNAHQHNKIALSEQVTLPTDPSVELRLSSFGLIITYSSVDSARKYKVGIRQFPRVDEPMIEDGRVIIQNLDDYNTGEKILGKMRNVDINGRDYQFEVLERLDEDSCEVQAQKQLFQGLSYEFGTLVIKNGSQFIPNSPKQLYSFSPSRKRFPWGFLWDDGFHCEVGIRKDPQLTLKVIKSWLNTMDESGWIPRQQNRGPQRQYLCSCPRFMAKDIRDGNPPTLILALQYMARNNKLTTTNFPNQYLNKLQKWYKWFSETQTEDKNSYIYRWFDSIPGEGSFNSGMDDFPRLPSSQGHVDCQAWMYFFSTSLAKIKESLGQSPEPYQSYSKKILQTFHQHFIAPKQKIPSDFTQMSAFPSLSPLTAIKKQYNPHFGYPSILPLAFGMLDPHSQQYKETLKKISQQLDSGYGLTSISMKDSMYLENNSAYWRGPVWININYLILRGLKLYYTGFDSGMYERLKAGIVGTVCQEEVRTGYFYQNYINGKGSFSYPFTGWTALIAIIVRQSY